jgi:hypothetical protein
MRTVESVWQDILYALRGLAAFGEPPVTNAAKPGNES